MKIPFAELSAKSCYSFLKGASRPEEMVNAAYHLGYQAIALTDDHGFYGMVKAFKAAEDLKLHFITGTEIKLNSGSLILLAKNFLGYKQICKFLSHGLQAQPKDPIFNISELLPLTDKNIYLLLPPRDFINFEDFKKLRESFSVTQLITKKFHPDSDLALKKWLHMIPKEIPRAWTWDAFYHHAKRHELSEVMQAIRLNTPLAECLSNPNGEAYLKKAILAEKYGGSRKHLLETIKISEACSFSPREIKYLYPNEWLPTGKTAFIFLKELCEEGMKKRYPHGIPASVKIQLKHELDLIKKLNFEDYFLTVWDIVNFARSQKILCQGRGSAANSVVCYLLEITSIDPIQMNLLFERFISEERNEAPDIDIDFEHERREEVIQYIYKKYGTHRAGMVATLITYRTRSAIRDVGKALSIPMQTIESYSKRAAWKENIFKTPQPPDAQIKRWLRLAESLKGFPRHLGQHSGGMILTHDRLDEISPIQPATMPGRTIVQWDKYDIEILGLLKIDFLSLGMLTCIRKSFELIQKTRGIYFELHTLPPDDSKTYAMIQRSETVGVFQIESRAQMSMLPRLKPRNFYDLVIEVGIVRPGPIQGGMIHPYLRRRLGLEKVTYAHPKLKPILEKTLGIPLFQEQVMKMAIEVAGYTPGEADGLRRSMGTWKKSGNLEKHSKDLCARLIKNQVPQEFAERICQQILGFGEYGFPESHSASFALLSYASAYIKAHYPEVFLCALLNSMPMGFYPFHMLTMSFQREGVQILPVTIENSEWDHQLEFLPTKNIWALRLGFRCVRDLQKTHVEKFIEKRKSSHLDISIFNITERAALAMTKTMEEKRQSYWKSLIPSEDTLPLAAEKEPTIPKLKVFQNMLLDFKFIETSIGSHPVILAKEHQWFFKFSRQNLQLAQHLSQIPSNRIITVFGMTQIVQSPPTANGMCFITLEDETGYLNLVLTPPIFKKYKSLIQNEWALLVSGKLQNESGSISILVNRIYLPEVAQKVHSLNISQSHEPNAVELFKKRLWG